jgi:polyhydroxyalkanoate synthesis regulator phasin
MGPDDLRSFAQMASGLTVATTAKAREVVTGLLSQGMTLSTRAVPAPQMVGQVQELADNLVTTSRDNRELLVGMIRTEVDKAVGRMGFVREDELAALRRHVERIEHQVNDLSTTVAGLSSRMVATAPPEAAEEAAAPAAEPAPEPSIEDLASGSPATQGAPDAPVKKKKKKIIVDPDAAATS